MPPPVGLARAVPRGGGVGPLEGAPLRADVHPTPSAPSSAKPRAAFAVQGACGATSGADGVRARRAAGLGAAAAVVARLPLPGGQRAPWALSLGVAGVAAEARA